MALSPEEILRRNAQRNAVGDIGAIKPTNEPFVDVNQTSKTFYGRQGDPGVSTTPPEGSPAATREAAQAAKAARAAAGTPGADIPRPGIGEPSVATNEAFQRPTTGRFAAPGSPGAAPGPAPSAAAATEAAATKAVPAATEAVTAGEAAAAGGGRLAQLGAVLRAPVTAASAVNAAKVLGKGSAYIAPAAGAVQTFLQSDDTKRRFEDSLGVESAGGAALAGIARLATNIGNQATFGQAERLGRGISSAFSGGTFSEGYAQPRTAEAVTQTAGPRADFSNVQAGSSSSAIGEIPPVPRGAAAAEPKNWTPEARAALDSTVPGTNVINGRSYTKEQLDALANRNVVTGSGSSDGGGATTTSARSGVAQGGPSITDLANRERSDRLEQQGAANERLAKLYKKFESAIGRNKLRSASAIGDLIGKELGVVEGTTRGQIVDPNAHASEFADAGRLGAITEGIQYDNQKKRAADQALATYMDSPDSPEGKRALTQYQAIVGKPTSEYGYQTIMGENGQRVIRTDKTGGPVVDVTPVDRGSQAAAAIAAGADPEKVKKRLAAGVQ